MADKTEENSNNFVVFGAVALAIALVIVLLLVFNGNDDEQVEDSSADDQSQIDQSTPADDQNRPADEEQTDNQTQPVQDDNSTDTVTTDNPESQAQGETTELGQLPANWEQLTNRQKTDLNPYDCDIEIEFIYADDGSCHLKSPTEIEDDEITEPDPPTRDIYTRAELEDYLESPEYTHLQKRDTLSDYCYYDSPDDCVGLYSAPAYDTYDECSRGYWVGSLCGSEVAHERWQNIVDTTRYKSLYAEEEAYWEAEYSEDISEGDQARRKESYILQAVLHKLGLEFRLEHGIVGVTFAQSSILIVLLK